MAVRRINARTYPVVAARSRLQALLNAVRAAQPEAEVARLAAGAMRLVNEGRDEPLNEVVIEDPNGQLLLRGGQGDLWMVEALPQSEGGWPLTATEAVGGASERSISERFEPVDAHLQRASEAAERLRGF